MNAPVSTQTELAERAAHAAAQLVPSSVPLLATRTSSTPPADAQAVVAAFVGSPSAELALVADAAVVDAVAAGAAAGAALALSDALRPALEAAAATLGSGVLDGVRTEAAGRVVGPDTEVFALQADGVDVAWFTLRVRGPRVSAGAALPSQRTSMRVLYDVEMTLTAELGRTRLPLRQVLELTPGAVLELDRTAGSPADVMVNGRLIARGEVVVIDEDYGIRITEIVAGTEPVA